MIDRELSANTITAWREIFGRYVGLKKFMSFEALEAASGVTISTLRDISNGRHGGSTINTLAILDILPDNATNMLLSVIGKETHAIAGDVCPLEMAAAKSEATRKVTKAYADDGHMDHQEYHAAVPSVERSVSLGQRFIANGPPKRRYMTIERSPFLKEAGD